MSWHTNATSISREFIFANQTELAHFVLTVAQLSDELNHHADMEIYEWRKLRITITTHDAGGITQKDHDWIRQVDALIGT